MPLAPGTRLGPYEIVSALGAGGMGEVYRARDPRLGRDVAIVGDVTADGKRFLLIAPVGPSASVPFTVVLNWTAGLK